MIYALCISLGACFGYVAAKVYIYVRENED